MPFRGGPGYGLQNRTKEERKAISRKGVEARMKNSFEKLHLQRCMRTLLQMDVSDQRQKDILEMFGYHGSEDQNNATLLMVALFRKGLTGDVNAIREITNMMDKLDMYQETKRLQSEVNIFVQTVGKQYVPNEEDEEEIRKAEQEDIWDDAEEKDEWDVDDSNGENNDWGNEVYDG